MEYKKTHEAVIINITHNLSDLEYMEGKYYYINNLEITEIASKELDCSYVYKGGIIWK